MSASAHGHDEPGHASPGDHGDHGHAAHSHDSHGHDSHGHGHGHEAAWGDYNAEEPEPSNLPPVNPGALAIFALALAGLLGGLLLFALKLSSQEPHASGKAAPPAAHHP